MSVETGNWTGRKLSGGRYQIAAKLGEGGMGHIYRAWDNHLECDVVIKVPQASMHGVDDFARRFLREGQSLVRLAHPHIVRVLDVDQEEGVCFAVMPFLSGGSLHDRPTRNTAGAALPMSPDTLRGWLEPVANTLDFIHGQHYIHRDVKPPNILFDGHGHVYLSDFGMAKALAAVLPDNYGTNLTGSGMLIGTPGYVAPEQIMGEAMDGRSDQYGLAATVYEMLVGQSPFAGLTLSAVLVHQTTRGACPPHEACPSIPAPVSLAIHRGLSIDPNRRFATCAEFSRAVLQATPALASTVIQPVSVRAGQPPLSNQQPAKSCDPDVPILESPVRTRPVITPPSIPTAAIAAQGLPLPGLAPPAIDFPMHEPVATPPVGSPIRTMVIPGLSSFSQPVDQAVGGWQSPPPLAVDGVSPSRSPILPLPTPPPSSDAYAHMACPKCRRPLRIPKESIGKKVQCPKCGASAVLSSKRQGAGPVRKDQPQSNGSERKTATQDSAMPKGAPVPPPLPTRAAATSTHWYLSPLVLAAAGIIFGVGIVLLLSFTNIIDIVTPGASSRSATADEAK